MIIPDTVEIRRMSSEREDSPNYCLHGKTQKARYIYAAIQYNSVQMCV